MAIALIQPQQGSVDWAANVNDNFAKIEGALNVLAGATFVASYTVPSSTGSFNITGLSGETDGVYLFVSRFVNANAVASEWLGVKPLTGGGTTPAGTYDGQDFENNGAVSSGSSFTGCMVMLPTHAQQDAWGLSVFFPRLTLDTISKRRSVVTIGNFGSATAPSSTSVLSSADWSDVMNAITGFQFALNSGNSNIGRGTHVAIYKLRLE